MNYLKESKRFHGKSIFLKMVKFWVTKASSIKSKLFSPSDIQSIVKKAMVERLKQKYHTNWFEESGASYPVRIFLLKDEVMVGH